MPTPCKTCGEVLMWATTRTGERIPLNPTSQPVSARTSLHGLVVLDPQPNPIEGLRCHVLSDAEASVLAPRTPTYTAHKATCVDPNQGTLL